MALKSQKANDTRHFFDPFLGGFCLFGGYPPDPPLPPLGGGGGQGIPWGLETPRGYRGVRTPGGGRPGGPGAQGQGPKIQGAKIALSSGLNTTLRGTPLVYTTIGTPYGPTHF